MTILVVKNLLIALITLSFCATPTYTAVSSFKSDHFLISVSDPGNLGDLCLAEEVRGHTLRTGSAGGDDSYVIATGQNLDKEACARECCNLVECDAVVWYPNEQQQLASSDCFLISCLNLTCQLHKPPPSLPSKKPHPSNHRKRIPDKPKPTPVVVAVAHSETKIPQLVLEDNLVDLSNQRANGDSGQRSNGNSGERSNGDSGERSHDDELLKAENESVLGYFEESVDERDDGLLQHEDFKYEMENEKQINSKAIPLIVSVLGVGICLLLVLFLVQFTRYENTQGYSKVDSKSSEIKLMKSSSSSLIDGDGFSHD